MKPWFFLIILFLAPALHAVDLFGVNLQSATRDQLRAAVKNAGVKLVSQAGEEEFFDTYEADSIIPGANHLYLGFTKKSQQFAFAEYRFPGLKQDELLSRLSGKYGKPEAPRPRFLSDQKRLWRSGEVEISLYTDWRNYSTRLVYFHPARLQELRLEQRTFIAGAGKKQEYLEQGY